MRVEQIGAARPPQARGRLVVPTLANQLELGAGGGDDGDEPQRQLALIVVVQVEVLTRVGIRGGQEELDFGVGDQRPIVDVPAAVLETPSRSALPDRR
ncbi:MAG TPA: hypothetical protein VIA06_20285 [Candidatus Dormibacteraeota bacterium]|nr:hypothetical protein [Candidatus Dormibacteraeota bacterium]